jgi:hypothetical protein
VGDLPPGDALVVRLGRRRAAEIAVEEGELLSLRLPKRALPLLSQALGWFEACNDPVGMMLSGIALALVQVNQRAMQDLTVTVSKVEQAYSRLQAGQLRNTELPDWNGLMKIPALIRASMKIPSLPRTWRPWLTRLIICLFPLGMDEAQKAAPTAPLEQWLMSMRYGSIEQGRTLLPADLVLGWPIRREPPLEAEGSPKGLEAAQPSRPSRLMVLL